MKIKWAILLAFALLDSAFAMDLAQIVDKYPKGWTSIRDEKEFYQEVFSLLPPDTGSDCEEEIENLITEEQAEQATRTIYKRSEEALLGKNDDLLVSILYFASSGDDFISLGLNGVLKEFLTARGIGEDAQDRFLGETLWRIQLEAMRDTKLRFRKNENVEVFLIRKCIKLLFSERQEFVKEEIIPEVISCGFKKALPYWALK